jgi:hypothetical protein
MTTNTRGLTNFYGAFFLGALEVAFCPYTFTFNTITGDNPDDFDYALAIGAILVLTFAVPVLPEITSFTFAIATIAASLALSSMFITYPIALIMDAIEACEPDSSHIHSHN